jgi:hypothetical protein
MLTVSGENVVVILRSIFMAGLVLLILLPLWAGGYAMDHATGMQGAAGWSGHHAQLAQQITARLDTLRLEIAADLCRRDARPICVAGMCVPLAAPDCPDR